MTDSTQPMYTLTQNDLDANKAYAQERALTERTDVGKRLEVPTGHRVVLAAGVSLKGADLRYANLARADLARADLARADLADAYLAGAYLAGANLADAYLAGANLAGADLAGADLARADLARADLADAYLAGANLAGADLARADLARADLAGADLAGADLAGADLADAYLAGADLAGANLAGAKNVPLGTSEGAPRPQLVAPVIAHIDAVILAAIEGPSAEGKLDMAAWHTCETTHCRAGWAVVKAGAAGRELEAKVGTQRAATLIYRASRPDKPVPHWFAQTDRALADIRACAAEDPLPAETA